MLIKRILTVAALFLIFAGLAAAGPMRDGKWWNQPKAREALNLTSAETEQLDRAFAQSQRTRFDLTNNMAKARFDLAQMLDDQGRSVRRRARSGGVAFRQQFHILGPEWPVADGPQWEWVAELPLAPLGQTGAGQVPQVGPGRPLIFPEQDPAGLAVANGGLSAGRGEAG